MSIIPWNPLKEMDDLLAHFNRNLANPVSHSLNTGNWVAAWAPAVDITEDDKEYLVKAELPGVKKEDVDLKVLNGILTLSGERKTESEQKDARQHRVERSYGSFTRSFSMPEDIISDQIKADFKDGVMTIHLPKDESVNRLAAKKIEIH